MTRTNFYVFWREHYRVICYMARTRKNLKRAGGMTAKRQGGIAGFAPIFESDKSKKLMFNGTQEVLCELCKSNSYVETFSSMDKSKTRTIVREFVFGDSSENLDNTSVILYTCNTCGLCKIVRNKDVKIVSQDI